MKNLLILATMLFTFGFANAQSKIYQKDGYSYREVGKYEGGKIYQKDGYSYREIGKYEGGKIYLKDGYSYREVGKTDGGGEAGGLLLLL
jgi:hypothetical protein